MTIASEITRINTNIANAYDAIEDKGGTIPASPNSANLADAIDSIPSSSSEVRGYWSVPPAYTYFDKFVADDEAITRAGLCSRLGLGTPTSSNTYGYSIGLIFRNYVGDFTITLSKDYRNTCVAIKTTDGSYYEYDPDDTSANTITHTWDTTKDLVGGYRGIIYYFVGTSGSYEDAGVYTSQNSSSYGNVHWGKFNTDGTCINSAWYYHTYAVFNVDTMRYNHFTKSLYWDDYGTNILTESVHFVNNHKVYDGTGAWMFPSRTSYSYSDRVKYFPSFEEAGIVSNQPTSYTNATIRCYPRGLDLSAVTSDITVGNPQYFEEDLLYFYVILPAVNVTFNSLTPSSSYTYFPEDARPDTNKSNFRSYVKLTKDNWQYLADNAPTVSGKTLIMNNYNYTIVGGSGSSIVTAFENKGWTVSAS